MMHVGIPAEPVTKRLTWSQSVSRWDPTEVWQAQSESTIYHVLFRNGGWTVWDNHGGAWGLYRTAHQAMNAVDLLNQ